MKPFNTPVPVKKQHVVPSGLTPFTIYAIYHVGLISWSKDSTETTDTLILGLELPELPALEYKEQDGSVTKKPQTLNPRFRFSMSPKANIRKLLEGWRGKAFSEAEASAFQVASLLGKSGLVNVIHKQRGDKTFADVGALMKGKPVVGTLKPIAFSVRQLENASELANVGLPPWIVKIVESSEDYMELLRNGGRAPEPAVVTENRPPEQDPAADEVPL